MKIEEVATLLNVLDDPRAAALQRSIDRERSARAGKADKARPPAPAAGNKGGKGNPARDSRGHDRGQGRPPHAQNRGRPDHRDNRDNQDKRPRGQQDIKTEDKAAGRPAKRR